jgi:hypothetical protein
LNLCQAAVKDDPTSASGKAAAAKIPDLTAKKADADTKAAAARVAQQRAAATNLATLKAKLRAQVWEVEDDECTGKGLPPHAMRFTNGTFDEIATVAGSMGCRNPMPMSSVVRTWCCPTAQEL